MNQLLGATTHLINAYKFCDFLDDLDKRDADINVVSIGCQGIKEQQVLPWVLRTAKERPDLKIQIDLFDTFEETPPDCANNPEWEKVSHCLYQHRQWKNLTVKVNEYFFPDSQKLAFPYLYHAIVRLNQANKLVIMSQHTGGNVLGPVLLKLFHKIHTEIPPEHRHFCLLAQSGRPPEVFDTNHPVDSFLRDIRDILGYLVFMAPNPTTEGREAIVEMIEQIIVQKVDDKQYENSSILPKLALEYRQWDEQNRLGENPIERFVRNLSFDFDSLDQVIFSLPPRL